MWTGVSFRYAKRGNSDKFAAMRQVQGTSSTIMMNLVARTDRFGSSPGAGLRIDLRSPGTTLNININIRAALTVGGTGPRRDRAMIFKGGRL